MRGRKIAGADAEIATSATLLSPFSVTHFPWSYILDDGMTAGPVKVPPDGGQDPSCISDEFLLTLSSLSRLS